MKRIDVNNSWGDILSVHVEGFEIPFKLLMETKNKTISEIIGRKKGNYGSNGMVLLEEEATQAKTCQESNILQPVFTNRRSFKNNLKAL